ncbi:MAG: hypothetical protein LHV69_04370 [Elusimicrobia bacterium]|nr:hypothetical protein [Candidatus Obscuribacterium magneticum]
MGEMKPQDVIVMLKLHLWKEGRWTIATIAKSIGLSDSETHAAIRRSLDAGIYDPLLERPRRDALEEFILHGVKYAFPAQVGPQVRGMPTAHSAPPLAGPIISDEKDRHVWPYSQGKVLGFSVTPLYSSAPVAASNDQALYEMLALIDCLRIGRVREKQLAAEEITKRLGGAGDRV